MALACLAAVGSVAAGHRDRANTGREDPFAFFRPAVTLDAPDRVRLERGQVIVRILPARNGELAVFAASRLDAPADALVTWTHAITELKKSPFVLAIRRFSDPPVLQDLDDLVLDQEDLDAIRRCRNGDCDLKLSANEIQSLRAAGAGAPGSATIQQEFRRVVLNRVNVYRAEGLAGLPPYADRDEATRPQDAFLAILGSASYLQDHLPDIASRLQEYPRFDMPAVESFFYWSKEQYGTGRRVITVTHVDIVRPDTPSAPAVLVLSKEVFATHYRNGSLGVTVVLQDVASDVRYLAYMNRSQVDVLGGLLGGLKRILIEGRLRDESKEVVRAVRNRLESGQPQTSP